ncbi:ABC transporter substrate-binding protein [Actinoalloteichus sp. AHMU CJ021]|uniref:Peptide/nickel transport system substrate-binding protein n=1 Tax=Actinoalloteichus caeruleus DSM 43889 TaxID=1120930 RepID=A0ABT1JDU1_ACTCY|nr:ABC transporter substrate-binding protein [Actinoalloteichus caeruleus]AUS81126.1 ABC transporter substrate-binding protein [Actinoalloteichus sp. AHMU CJ021]MCP2330665.1 peptide/nickel transport system substrate-binding protein [Actinoalloteichus caeruleus DSM 43889]
MPWSSPNGRPGRWRTLGVVTTAGLVLGGCAPLVEPQTVVNEERSGVDLPVRKGGEISVALDADPDALDPTLSSTLVGRQVYTSVCEKLYDVGENLEIVPQLAADLPEISDDGLDVTIPLRRDLLFNDGTALDAHAVKRSLDRHREMPASRRATELESVRSVEVVDADTVRLRLHRPYAPLTSMLADRAGMILSPTALDELGEDFGQAPVCVGPFHFVERVAQDRIVVERSEHYYDADLVNLDRIVYRPIPDPTIRLANLRSGQLDAMWKVSPDDLPAVSNEDGLTLLNQPSIQYMGMSVNVMNTDGNTAEPGQVEGPLAEDPRVRQALALSLDRDTINEVVFSGLHQPACGPIPPSSEFATEETQACPEHDPDRARELLAEAGVQTPVPVELMISNEPLTLRLGQVIQAMAAEAGFQVRLRPTEFAASIAEAQSGNFQTYISGWSGRPDPDGNIGSFHVRSGANNYSGHFTPETDELIREAAEETDPERRRDLYSELVPRLRDFNNIIYLYRERLYAAHSTDLAGVRVYPDGLMRFREAGFVAEGGEG